MSTITTFSGNLTDDPELRFTPSGVPVTEFRILTNRRVKDGDQWKDAEPTAHNLKIWGRAAENAAATVGKGTRVTGYGQVQTEAWTDKDTNEKRTKDVIVITDRFGDLGPSMKFATANVTKNTKPVDEAPLTEEPPF